ncbi:class I SAM-dependent methyltransferase [Amycolatopsis australiensis]|uniref:Methyltransferase domain-containing protein n=1 Tax=Amycolatopsis australiensis TaxID=546364 RepID=A0A1K1T4W3_9PSEU|nr:methyltransferase domain-containing protein [Amycolatopsis australiensis]SFW91627.1 Methyltransferase domain-containing protein [Amycolatopsis australiensis]
MTDSFEVNKANWDERAVLHAASPGYGFPDFAADPAYLSAVVRFDRPRLGDIAGLRAVHLQCHIGTDTVSLARLGASVTGLDFSGAALAQARRLAAVAGVEIDFREANVHDAVEVLGAGRFDLVYTGIGALCWLPSAARWASVVAGLLRPGGRLFIREGHPMLGTLDETTDPAVPRYPYFEHAEPLVFDEPGSYVEVDGELTHTVTHEWAHSLGEIITALLDNGLTLTGFTEHDSVPWNALPGQMAPDEAGEEWRLKESPQRLAASYTLQAVKGG